MEFESGKLSIYVTNVFCHHISDTRFEMLFTIHYIIFFSLFFDHYKLYWLIG